MPAVLVHGVPETPAIWGPLRSKLRRSDVAALQLPGFGIPPPEGFGATKEEYVTWLVGELERLHAGGPVDLVGHDWGGGFVVRVVSIRPDLVAPG
jgi:pimeloyl-ACP methyl ester carboxylesterase